MDDETKKGYFCRVFQSGEGGKVLEELKNFARFDDGRYISDPHLAAYMQGRRSVVCEIINIMESKKYELQN